MKLTIPGQPITKKNSQQILVNKRNGRPMIFPSKQFKAYEKVALAALGGPRHAPLFTGDIAVRVSYYLQDNRRPDLLNLLQATADILEAAGVIANDRDIISFDGSRIMGKSPEPRAEIEILPVQNQTKMF